jgi:hypothetical protein
MRLKSALVAPVIALIALTVLRHMLRMIKIRHNRILDNRIEVTSLAYRIQRSETEKIVTRILSIM